MAPRRSNTARLLAMVAMLAPALAGAISLTDVAIAADDDGARYTDVVVANAAPVRERLLQVMSRLPDAVKIATLQGSSAEVWRIPRHAIDRVATEVGGFGCTIMEVSEDQSRVEYRAISDIDLSPEQRSVLGSLLMRPESVGAGVVSLPAPALLEHVLSRAAMSSAGEWEGPAASALKLSLPLPDGRRVTLVRKRPIARYEDGLTWVGSLEDTGERALLMLANDGGLSGYFAYKGRIYAVGYGDGNVQTMTEIDPQRLPPDHSPGADAGRLRARAEAAAKPVPAIEPFRDQDRRRLEAKPVTIDLMLLYTRSSVARYLAKPNRWSAIAVELTNETLRSSGLGNVTVRLVHHGIVDYDDTSGEQFDHLYRMVDGVGAFAAVRKLRDEKRADIVGLVLHNPTGCGLSTRVAAGAEEAYFVVHHACAAITYSIPHEIGHILGARHDRGVDPSEMPFPYGHGYVHGTSWRTMMSYQESCGGCPRIPFWSSPRVLYDGVPTGTPAADNARVILENAARVAQFR